MCLAIPGRITETWEKEGLKMGRVDFGGIKREVCLSYVPEAGVDDYVVVHVGFAINVLDEAEAQATLELIGQIEDLGEELGPDPPGAEGGGPAPAREEPEEGEAGR
jgi:hydrogenase expression/formation protein HypC